MRKGLSIIVAILSLSLLCCCVTGTDISKKNKDGSPIWTSEIPSSNKYLYGVGKAKLTIDSNSQQAADAAARADLALKINVNIKDALSLYINEASDVVVSAYETLILQSVNLTLKKVVVEQRWTASDGTVWSLVSFRVRDLPDLYADAANDYLNQLEERRVSTQEKLAVLLEELKDSTDGDAIELKNLAQEKADFIIKNVIEIVRSLNVSEQTKNLALFLKNCGFELDEN